ncbi:helix-turn-helix transcriptional regulator [Mycolicibacterium helvum]|uniref:Helix-turn-helix transcriptional regulator n=1 Tax=Mycolicibacterium helvum TaxID=1534349 RepID=A0A7I7T6M9_9MYCO|nr:LuxR C-terminal-related transcriptional regulator [Mycolicibacterium helvum]BBY64912.1 helix-turn-helix transcriptional regulator [Mycolicibacterium helvum]
MAVVSPLLRPRDSDALRAELRLLAQTGSLPVLFAGSVDGDVLLLSEFAGTRTNLLRGLTIRPRSGLGGISMVTGRPHAVADYRRAATITHEHDVPVSSEGLRAVFAAPVLVEGVARAVIYGAHRSSAPIAGRAADLVVQSARTLSYELRVRDEVDRRVRMQQAHASQSGPPVIPAPEIRAVHAELRRLAKLTTPVSSTDLLRLAGQLSRSLLDEAPDAEALLTPREMDVLIEVGLGCTNRQAAQRLSLRPETVKAYLRSASAKLGTSSRHEAVATARRLKLIP